MKQLLFLLLFPCFAIAQYQGNGNQKITLGEQTTADGLVWRGLRADTTSKIVPFSDTSAYIILDTVEKTLWLYKAGQVPKWQQVGGSTLDTATMLLPYYRAGRNTIIQAADVPTLNQNTTGSAATLTTGRTIQTNLASTSAATFNGSANITPGVTGVLPVANGGTNTNTLTANKVMVGNGTSGVLTPTNLHWDNTNSRLGIGTTSPDSKLSILNNVSMVSPIVYAGFNTTTINSVPSNIQAYQIGTQYRVRQNIATGSTNSGYLMGMDFDVTTYTTSSGFSGTLADLIGQRFHFGNESGGGNTPTITNAYGIILRPFYMNGTISNLYALYIGDDATGGNITNNFGIYQSTSSAKNYFNGNVGIGTASPLSKLNVMGTVRINSAAAPDANYYLQLENSSSQKAKAFAWDTYSDKRIKTDIQPIFNAIDKVNLLNPVYYQKHDSYVENDFLNIDFDSSVKSLGFIAQEVYNVIPEAVNTGTTNELWAMDYTKIIPILTKAIQEQQALIKALEQRILNLENK